MRISAHPEFSCRLAVVNTPKPPSPDTTEVSILLTCDQVMRLDQVAIAIRRRTGRALSRSAMIRAIVNPVLPYHQNWLSCESESELRQEIANQLSRGNR